jgi:hypothetical protein
MISALASTFDAPAVAGSSIIFETGLYQMLLHKKKTSII